MKILNDILKAGWDQTTDLSGNYYNTFLNLPSLLNGFYYQTFQLPPVTENCFVISFFLHFFFFYNKLKNESPQIVRIILIE